MRRRKEYVDFVSRTRQRSQNQRQSPIVANLTSPKSLYLPETIFKLMRDYNHGRWGAIPLTADRIESVREANRKYDEASHFIHGVKCALQNGDSAGALRMMRRAPEVSTCQTGSLYSTQKPLSILLMQASDICSLGRETAAFPICPDIYGPVLLHQAWTGGRRTATAVLGCSAKSASLRGHIRIPVRQPAKWTSSPSAFGIAGKGGPE